MHLSSLHQLQELECCSMWDNITWEFRRNMACILMQHEDFYHEAILIGHVYPMYYRKFAVYQSVLSMSELPWTWNIGIYKHLWILIQECSSMYSHITWELGRVHAHAPICAVHKNTCTWMLQYIMLNYLRIQEIARCHRAYYRSIQPLDVPMLKCNCSTRLNRCLQQQISFFFFFKHS